MPHVFDVDGSFVFGLALFLEVEGGKHVDWFIDTSLEEDVVAFEVFVSFFYLVHGV